jgi:transposase, IS5 family
MSSNTDILSFANPEYPIIQLADQLPWDEIKEAFIDYYSPKDPIQHPLRLMAGLVLLQHLYGLDAEDLVEEWISNPYLQYFTGETKFQWDVNWEPSVLEHFTESINPELIETILMTCAFFLELQEDAEESGEE